MKKRNIILVVSMLGLAALASCSNGKDPFRTFADPEDIVDLINSVKGTSHKVTTVNEVYVNQHDELSEDIYLKMDQEYTHSYKESGERALKLSKFQTSGSLIKGTHNLVSDSSGNPYFDLYDHGEHLYFRDEENGTVISEYIDATNSISTFIQAEYDFESGIYDPIIFDAEFRNPFDFIQPRDIKKTAENTYALSADKSALALSCYAAIGAANVKGATIHTEGGKVSSIDFEITPDGGPTDTYERTTTLSATYSDFGAASELNHLTPYNNNNPRLASALKRMLTADSYKYTKTYLLADGTPDTVIGGYITPDCAYYHHKDDVLTDQVYTLVEDFYDYLAVRCEGNDKYYAYEAHYDEPGSGVVSWDVVTVSQTSAYSVDSMVGLGSRCHEVSAKIFTLKEGTENVYVCEDPNILKGLAAYFDFQFLGVNSQILETRTNRFELTLEEDGSFHVDTGYAYSDSGRWVEQRIAYDFDASSVNNTTIPGYLEIPDASNMVDL